QPPRAVHPRQRRDHEPGDPQERRRAADLLSAEHSPGRDRRPCDPGAAHLLRRGDRRLCHRQGRHRGVRLSERQRQRLSQLRRNRRSSGRRNFPQNSVRVVFRGPQHRHHPLHPRRTTQQRVRAIAPFLRLDHDPYVVVSDGRLFWIQDAYTTSDYFPYAQPLPDRGLNYIRNSVKVVIDAYNGTVDFYLADASDAIAATYQRIFPELFKPLDAMSGDLQKHIRYPEDLFRIQAQLSRAYHMDSPEVFYNREDLWQFPRQPGGENATMVPYYIIMRLPGEPQAEFFLMLPMVPT